VADRTPNLLGALSLVVSDRMSDAIIDAGGQSHTAAAALSALLHFLSAPSIDLLRQVLGLTPSGTVRLVDRLEEAGYVRRRPGHDDRSVAVVLTASGRRAAERVSNARATVLEDALTTLSAGDRRTFEQLASRLLVGLMRGPGAVRWMCRLCDTHTCGHDAGTCPVTRAAREKYVASQPKTSTPTA
jgi:DNA-binding MarR family transcriptional regulator